MNKQIFKKLLIAVLLVGMLGAMAACSNAPAKAGDEPEASTVAPDVSNEPSETPAASEEAVVVEQPEGYPSKTIEFIVPAPAGAALDLYTRSLNEQLDLGTPLQITNMAGGSQTIGMMELATRKGDGYSLGIVAFAGGIIQPQLVDVTYDLDSFRPVAITSGPNSYTICVSADSDVTDYASFEEMLSGEETVYWTSANAGSPPHLAGLYYLQAMGITNCEYVSYTGSAEATTALLSGDVSFLVIDDSTVATREADGQVTGILTLSDERSPILPDVPSAAENGVDNMGVFDAFSWAVMPADTPDEIYNWVKQQIDTAVTSDAYQEFLANNNFVEMRTYSEEELKDMISKASAAISEVIGLLD